MGLLTLTKEFIKKFFNLGEFSPGLYWHVHHLILLEWCYDYSGRVKFIKRYKAKYEHKTRLRLFKRVKGTLPQELIDAGQTLYKADQACVKTGRVFYKACQVFDKAVESLDTAQQSLAKTEQSFAKAAEQEAVYKIWELLDKADKALAKTKQSYNKAGQALDKTKQALAKTEQSYNNAWQTYYKVLNENMPAIEALHRKECPNCSWDGKTIFP